MINLLWWSDTLIRVDDAYADMLADFTSKARIWCVDHGGDMRGFSYGLVVPKTNWWDGKENFKAWAKADCKVWKLSVTPGQAIIFTQAVADTTPWKIEPAGYELDVSEVWRPGGWPPDWFVCFKQPTWWLVCLASETTETP
jgi:hypothetical protein